MAKLGFYDIRTFECLSREIEVRRHDFLPIGDPSVAKSLLPPEQEDGIATKRKQKQNQKESKRVSMLATRTKVEARGHTGYLTFAIKF